jgi:antirestriction protein ArdC
MLKITTDGKKLSIDARLLDSLAADEPESKINRCASKVAEIYQNTEADRATQLIMCDFSTPQVGTSYATYNSETNFNVYYEMKKKLIERGVKANEIAFIHDYKTDDEREALFSQVKEGDVRVLLGSTQKCGTGVNIQDRLIALHHLDAPYRPSDLEQREGRIIRQGNKNSEVDIYTYITERTFDAYLYKILESKQKFIGQVQNGTITSRTFEDISNEKLIEFGEVVAIATANPNIKKKTDLERRLRELMWERGTDRTTKNRLRNRVLHELPNHIDFTRNSIRNVTVDCETASNNKIEVFTIQLYDNASGQYHTYKSESADTARAFRSAMTSVPLGTVFAKYRGFEIYRTVGSDITTQELILLGSHKHHVSLQGNGLSDSEVGVLQRIRNTVNKMPESLEMLKDRLNEYEKSLEKETDLLNREWEGKAELEQVQKELDEINAELGIGEDNEVIIADNSDDKLNYDLEGLLFSDSADSTWADAGGDFGDAIWGLPPKKIVKPLTKGEQSNYEYDEEVSTPEDEEDSNDYDAEMEKEVLLETLAQSHYGLTPEDIENDKTDIFTDNKKETNTTTLGEDLIKAGHWLKVRIPKLAIAARSENNVKIVFGSNTNLNGSSFWVTNKFLKNEKENTYELILPSNYVVRVQDQSNTKSELSAKTVIDTLKDSEWTSKSYTTRASEQQSVTEATDTSKNVTEIDNTTKRNLSTVRADLTAKLIDLMLNGSTDWVKKLSEGQPYNPKTKARYNGVNNLYLSLTSIERGYNDNRWYTFNQLQEMGLKLKKGSKAVAIEGYTLIDKQTKKEFTSKTLDGMTDAEKADYKAKNVYPKYSYYNVFNASCVIGLEPATKAEKQPAYERCEKIVANSPTKIINGGNTAYYWVSRDEIRIPKMSEFDTVDIYYSTLLHEMAHATGHKTRLNRSVETERDKDIDELTAELTTLFISQKLGIKPCDKLLQTHVAHCKKYADKIKLEPNDLFKAIKQAEQAEKFILGLENNTQNVATAQNNAMKKANIQME